MNNCYVLTFKRYLLENPVSTYFKRIDEVADYIKHAKQTFKEFQLVSVMVSTVVEMNGFEKKLLEEKLK